MSVLLSDEGKRVLVEILKSELSAHGDMAFLKMVDYRTTIKDEDVARLRPLCTQLDVDVGELVPTQSNRVQSAWFDQLLEFFKRQGLTDCYKALYLGDVMDMNKFDRILRKWPTILLKLQNPKFLLPYADKLRLFSQERLSELVRLCDTAEDGVALRYFILQLPKNRLNWYTYFLQCLYSTGEPLCKELANDLHDGFDVCREAMLQKAYKEDAAARNLEIEKLTLGSSVTNGFKPANYDEPRQLELRAYQAELVEPVLSGKNTLICAPTGSGKTVVAAKAILHHLETDNADRKRKIVFFVPTLALVAQQTELIRSYLGRKFNVAGLTGGQVTAKEAPRVFMIRGHDVVVMTPQLLLNVLNHPEETSRMSLTEFSLLIFDECHHTSKAHPYNELMCEYFRLKPRLPSVKLPQIVGLTASLGVGAVSMLERAKQEVYRLCARLDAHQLSVVSPQMMEDLKRWVSTPADECVQVPLNSNRDTFVLELMTLMKWIETTLMSKLFATAILINGADGVRIIKRNKMPETSKDGEAYASWISNTLNQARLLPDADLKQPFIACLEYLQILNQALVINNHVSTKEAMAFLDQEMHTKQRKISEDSIEIEKKLASRFKYLEPRLKQATADKVGPSALVAKLGEILLTEFQPPEAVSSAAAAASSSANGILATNSRALVFVQTRDLTVALERFFHEHPTLVCLNACRLVGANVASSDGGQSKEAQEKIIRGFRNGVHKVMIATSVAEEGLDIPDCNLVIKYNYVSNDVAMVQKRGRGRAEGSRAILLTFSGAHATKELANMETERLTRQAIWQIKMLSDAIFLENVAKHQADIQRDQEVNENKRLRKQADLRNKVFEVLCFKCSQLICLSTEIRAVEGNHYYVPIVRDFWSRCVAAPHPKVRNFDTLSIAGRLECARCRVEWGIVIKFYDVFLPALSPVENLVFRECSLQPGQPRAFRKWVQVTETLFLPNPITAKDTAYMLTADNQPTQLEAAIESAISISNEANDDSDDEDSFSAKRKSYRK